MNLNKYILALAAAACLFASCKKDEDQSTDKSFLGSLTVSVPKYTNPGDSFAFYPDATTPGNCMSTTLKRESGDPGEIGYVLTVAELKVLDTLRNKQGQVPSSSKGYHILTIPDTLCTIAVTAKAFSSGYFDKSSTSRSTIVKPGFGKKCSIEGFDTSDPAGFTDARNGRFYYTAVAGGKTWMRNNLSYYHVSGKKYTFGQPYEGATAMEGIFGAFYTWEEAQKACPDGWRVPTASEWDALGKNSGELMADIYFNGEKMWEFWPEVKITDKTHLSAMPLGYATVEDGEYTYMGLNKYAMFWCNNAGKGEIRYIYMSEPEIKTGLFPGDNDFAVPLRCVKE